MLVAGYVGGRISVLMATRSVIKREWTWETEEWGRMRSRTPDRNYARKDRMVVLHAVMRHW